MDLTNKVDSVFINNLFLVLAVVTSITGINGLIIFSLTLYTSVYEMDWSISLNSKTDINQKKFNQQSVKILLLYSLCVIIIGILGCISCFITPESTSLFTCEYGIPKTYAALYVVSNFLAYQFLYNKAESVTYSLNPSKLYLIIKKITYLSVWLVLLVVVPIVIYYWSSIANVVENVDLCLPNPFAPVTILFSFGDLAISLLMMYLFSVPLIKHFKKKTKTDEIRSKKLLSIVKKNLLVGFVATTSTSFAMAFLTITTFFYFDRWDLRLIGIIVSCGDVNVSVLCAASMSNIWIPDKLKPYYNMYCCNCFETKIIKKNISSTNSNSAVNLSSKDSRKQEDSVTTTKIINSAIKPIQSSSSLTTTPI